MQRKSKTSGLKPLFPAGALAVLASLTLAGCAEIGYYGHTLFGGAKVLAMREKIERVLENPELDDAVRSKLEVALEAREFAVRELGLPDNKSYRTYVDLDREVVSWTVTAAPEFSVHPVTWCFPIAGCVSYKGFFDREKAAAFARELEAEGYDVNSGGVAAYSTLGWFADPILSTFLRRSETELAGLLFHELAHQVVYVKDSTEFNESFATAVELEGVRRWLAARGGDPEEVNRYREREARQDELTQLLLDYRSRLAELYASDLGETAMRGRKAETFGDLQTALVALRDTWGDPNALRGWIGTDLDNADLASVGAYHGWVPGFEALMAETAVGAPGLQGFYREVESLAKLDRDEREERLRALAPSEGRPE